MKPGLDVLQDFRPAVSRKKSDSHTDNIALGDANVARQAPEQLPVLLRGTPCDVACFPQCASIIPEAKPPRDVRDTPPARQNTSGHDRNARKSRDNAPSPDVNQHVIGHINCPACEAAAKEAMYSGHFHTYLFPIAARKWLDWRTPKLSPKSVWMYECHIKALNRFFAQLPLNQITVGHVMTYQRSRQRTAGASAINHEISCLSQVLGRAGLWVPIQKLYEPLPLPKKSIGIALTPEEERYGWELASKHPKWKVALCCAIISRNTTCGPSEIRLLRHRNIHLTEKPFIFIEEGVKNSYRERPIPLNADAEWAVRTLIERAKERGSYAPDHYLLPKRSRTKDEPPFDPTQPQGSWKKAHYAWREEMAKKFPRLATFRRYDWRHTAATVMLENPNVPIPAIEAMMGHRFGTKVIRRYEHLRNEMLKSASDALNSDARTVVEKKDTERVIYVIRREKA